MREVLRSLRVKNLAYEQGLSLAGKTLSFWVGNMPVPQAPQIGLAYKFISLVSVHDVRAHAMNYRPILDDRGKHGKTWGLLLQKQDED
jgi:hypothetical protein